MRQLEREKALLQHKSLESHRKAESEADRKRCLENEGDTRHAVDSAAELKRFTSFVQEVINWKLLHFTEKIYFLVRDISLKRLFLKLFN